MEKRVKYEYKELLANSAMRFCADNCTPGGDSGDISIRDPETGYIYSYPNIKPGFSFYSWRELKPENIAVCDIDGNLIETEYEPTIEIPMHLAIYKARPEVQVILHSHPKWSAIFACARKDIPLTLAEQALALGGETKCAEYAPAGAVAVGTNIVKALGKERNSALLANHGAVVLASSISEAFMRSEYLEHAAMVACFAELLGGAVSISPDEILDPSVFH
ncbi:MAG: class II aldolase/adducin family protein [Firmicutes bacterium]|nr:class II aldolase/adducin family protein [Bacillota bacterium]